MAIKLIANYSKRLGLPGYSSHQFSVSVEVELVTTDDVAAESQQLYQRLQASVDEQIQTTGFVPGNTYGMDDAPGANGSVRQPSSRNGSSWQTPTAWKCSEKLLNFISSFVEEHQLNHNDIEALAVERFGKGVRLLSKLEASGLIDELLERHGGNARPPANGRNNANAAKGGRR